MLGKFLGLIILGLCLNSIPASASSGDDSIIHQLDKMIAERSIYQEKLENEIADLQRTLEYGSNYEFRFNILGDIFEKYRSFLVDTAFVVAKQRMKVAKHLKKDQQDESLMNMADALNKMGRHRDALAILDKMQRTPYVLHSTYFYYLYHTIYLSCYDEEIDPDTKKIYLQNMKNYKDTLIAISPPNSASYIMNKCGLMNMNGKQEAALALLKVYYEKSAKNNPDRARMEYLMSELYLAKGDTINAKHYLILSSITDIGNAKKVYMSLQHLATILYKQGDIERAYNYITCALEDINFGKARYRILDIVQYLPIINTANNLRVIRNKTHIIYFSLLLFILASMLVVALILIYKKNIKLVKAQQSLEKQNKCLHEMTDDLAQMNRQIKESNHIKEEYIGMLFNICSEYISKQEDQRKALVRIVNTGQMFEVAKVVYSQSSALDELKSFMNQFDTIFLSIFPHFVEVFNQNLNSQDIIIQKEGELLTPELRIYALIRLGIADNSKIANFLHYSLQTVYNYRMKIRNKLIVSEKELLAHLYNI